MFACPCPQARKLPSPDCSFPRIKEPYPAPLRVPGTARSVRGVAMDQGETCATYVPQLAMKSGYPKVPGMYSVATHTLPSGVPTAAL
jgi:hypothetical protein